MLRPTSVVAILFYVLTNMLLQGDNKWISHRKGLFRDHIWHALKSPKSLLGDLCFHRAHSSCNYAVWSLFLTMFLTLTSVISLESLYQCSVIYL